MAAPIIAVAIISALKQVVNLGLTVSYSHSIFKHIVALFGVHPSTTQLKAWLKQASVAGGEPSRPPSLQRSRTNAAGKSAPQLLADMLCGNAPVEALRRTAHPIESHGSTSHNPEPRHPSTGVSRTMDAPCDVKSEVVAMASPLAGFELPPLLRYSALENEMNLAHAELRTVNISFTPALW